MAEGWIKLYRNIQEHWIWQDPQKLKWWLDILLLVNHKDNKFLLGNELMELKRGEHHTSEVKLAERWGVSKTTVRKFLNLLEVDGMIELKKSKKGTTLKVANYNTYQDFSEGEKTIKKPQKNHSVDHKKTIEEPYAIPQKNHEVYTNNNDKNDNNENNENNEEEGKEAPPPPLSIPSNLSEIQSLILNQFGDVTYKTWFLNTEIIDSDKELKLITPNDFTKGVISDRFKEPLETLLEKKVFIEERLE